MQAPNFKLGSRKLKTSDAGSSVQLIIDSLVSICGLDFYNLAVGSELFGATIQYLVLSHLSYHQIRTSILFDSICSKAHCSMMTHYSNYLEKMLVRLSVEIVIAITLWNL